MISRLLNWIHRNPVKAMISLVIILFHFGIFLEIRSARQPLQKRHPKKIIVRTVNEKKMISHAPAPAAARSIPQKTEAAPVKTEKKETPPKKVESKKAIPPKTPVQTKTNKKVPEKKKQAKKGTSEAAIPENLLKELEQSFRNIESKSKPSLKKNKLDLPKNISKLEIDQSDLIENQADDSSYYSSLIRRLQDELHLPEHGEVKIALTLKRDGSVIKVQVIKAESEKNRLFLEKHLPKVTFPHFPFDKQENTFILTFCNH